MQQITDLPKGKSSGGGWIGVECLVECCTSPVRSLWLCSKHYDKWYKYGDPSEGNTRYDTPEETFNVRTKWVGGCLVWLGHTIKGYGRIGDGGVEVMAHRYAWEQVHGPIGGGLHVDHRCHNPACCNVAHLRLATPKQNGENRKAHKNNKSGHRNVLWIEPLQKWRVSLMHNRVTYYGGYYADLHEAVEAAIALRAKHFTNHNEGVE